MAQIEAVEEELRKWDPIGVAPGAGGPNDEYDSYAPHIVSLVLGGVSKLELAAHLSHLRTDVIGMPPNEASDHHAAEDIINALRKKA